MKFFIVTPTFNNLSWLQACVRSVADQVAEGVEVHHHVQDGASTDGTPAWLAEWAQQHEGQVGYTFSYESVKDAGMYAAINTGWARLPQDADVTAQLNSDEQYLPGALAALVSQFAAHPQAEVLLGTYVIVDAALGYVCHRRPVMPRAWSSWLNCACITCSSFYRAGAFRARGMAYDTQYRAVSDLVFFRALTQQGVRFATVPVVTSSFVCTGENLAWTGRAHEEWLSLHAGVPPLLLKLNPLIYRWVNFKRRVADLFLPAPRELSVYHGSEPQRRLQPITQPTVRWQQQTRQQQIQGPTLPATGVLCCGCALCVDTCPHGALSMQCDAEGFLTPEADMSRCVMCGACTRACERAAKHEPAPRNVACFEAAHKDSEVRLASSSGGFFSAMAEEVLAAGGLVFGVCWASSFEAVFTAIEQVEDLPQLRGSKYVQANPQGVYKQVKEALKVKRRVLFAGTPCQVRALRTYLRQDTSPYLVALDIACHGVPSRRLLDAYIEEKELAKGPLRSLDFRSKQHGWRQYGVACQYLSGASDFCSHRDDVYMRAFIADLALNQACYACQFAYDRRPGDISMADHWGRPIGKDDDTAGFSSIIVSNPALEAQVQQLSSLSMRPIEVNELLHQNIGLGHSSSAAPHLRGAFMARLGRGGLTPLVERFTVSAGRKLGFECCGLLWTTPAPLYHALRRIKMISKRCLKR